MAIYLTTVCTCRHTYNFHQLDLYHTPCSICGCRSFRPDTAETQTIDYEAARARVFELMMVDCNSRHAGCDQCRQEAEELLEEYEQAIRAIAEGPPCSE